MRVKEEQEWAGGPSDPSAGLMPVVGVLGGEGRRVGWRKCSARMIGKSSKAEVVGWRGPVSHREAQARTSPPCLGPSWSRWRRGSFSTNTEGRQLRFLPAGPSSRASEPWATLDTTAQTL